MLCMQFFGGIPLDEPNVDEGFITWIQVEIHDWDDEGEGEGSMERIGMATVAIVHVGEAINSGLDLLEALDADSGELEAMYHVYFEGHWYKDEFENASGNDLLYIADIEIGKEYAGRNIELAVVRRLCDTIGHGCGLVVMPYESPAEVEHWSRMGFAVSTPGEPTGLMHMTMDVRRPRIADPDGTGRFRVLPNAHEKKGRNHH
jgi:hypothetical protein